MTRDILLLSFVVAMFAGLCWFMVLSLRWAKNRGQAQSSVGHALQELERLVTKPSIEHVVETETKLPKEDDHGGE